MQKINKFIADNALWIFLGAAAYKFTFYIINLVYTFISSVGSGVRSMFSGLLGAAWDLIVLAVILEVSKKIASGYPAEQKAPQQAPQPTLGQAPAAPGTAPMPAQQTVQPAQPVQPVPQATAQPAQPAQPVQQVEAQPAQPAQPTQPAIWTCPNCGSQNTEGMAFCAKCGTKR